MVLLNLFTESLFGVGGAIGGYQGDCERGMVWRYSGRSPGVRGRNVDFQRTNNAASGLTGMPCLHLQSWAGASPQLSCGLGWGVQGLRTWTEGVSRWNCGLEREQVWCCSNTPYLVLVEQLVDIKGAKCYLRAGYLQQFCGG